MTNTKRDELPDCPLFSEIVNQLCDHQELIDLSLRQLKDICLRHTARPSAGGLSVSEMTNIAHKALMDEGAVAYSWKTRDIIIQAIHKAQSRERHEQVLGTGRGEPIRLKAQSSGEATHGTGDQLQGDGKAWQEQIKADPTTDGEAAADYKQALKELLVAVTFKATTVNFGTDENPNPCYEARVPVGFVHYAHEVLSKHSK